MQPIPLDLDSLVTETPGFSLPMILLGALASIVGLVCLNRGTGKNSGPLTLGGAILFLPGFFSLLFGVAVFVAGDRPDYKARAEAIKARNELISSQIEESYGIELTEGDVNDLGYPTEAPKKDFERYGSVTISEQLEGADFLERKIYLVWADGSLQLSQSVDGENFEQLDRKD